MKIELSKELREVFQKLIPIYEKAVEELPKREYIEYLIGQFLDEGLCYASHNILKISIIHETSKILGYNDYWYNVPYKCATRIQAMDCLQWRINKMKELLEL